jgi:hypothetical protein
MRRRRHDGAGVGLEETQRVPVRMHVEDMYHYLTCTSPSTGRAGSAGESTANTSIACFCSRTRRLDDLPYLAKPKSHSMYEGTALLGAMIGSRRVEHRPASKVASVLCKPGQPLLR